MLGGRHGLEASLPLELHWSERQPLPTRWVAPMGGYAPAPAFDPRVGPLDFSRTMHSLCEDIAVRCHPLRHVDMSRVLVSFTPSRNRSRFGLQARVTPMRFRDGAMTRRHYGCEYQVQRFFVDGREMMYLLTFCLPRFLEQPFEEKLVTVFHELYHMSESFNGDLRRHHGRYAMHSHSKAGYDAHMAELSNRYLDENPCEELLDFLRPSYRELWARCNGIVGAVVPRPKLLPLGLASDRSAARR